jgi:hypothetical protein
MKKNRKSAAPEKSVLRDAKEVAAVEQYWHAAGRPKSRKPTKDYIRAERPPPDLRPLMEP